MSVTEFENTRWSTFAQKAEFRHHAALDLIHGGRVLDFACGDGVLLELLGHKGIDATGLDISEAGVAACRAKGLRAEVLEVGATWPFPDDSFDYVVMLDVLEHVYDPALLLKEARRVSKEFVIIGVPNFSSLPARLQVLCGAVPENNRPHKGHVYWFNYPILRKHLTQSNLQVVEERMNSFSIFKHFGTFFTWLSPNLFSLSFVVRVKK